MKLMMQMMAGGSGRGGGTLTRQLQRRALTDPARRNETKISTENACTPAENHATQERDSSGKMKRKKA